jgi:GNAT superfamily N-acetyltransferase
MHIRPARIETDLPAIVRIINPYETNPLTFEQVRSFFQHNPPGRIQGRLVVVDDNDAVAGYSGFVHEASAPAGHCIVWVIVDPAFRRQGLGASLWQACLAALQEQSATRLEVDVFDNDPVGLGFAQRRGFSLHHQIFRSTLDLAAFDETPYLPGLASLAAQGIRCCALSDFPDTPEIRHKLYDLNSCLALDIPNNDGRPPDYADFEKYIFEAPWFRREGQLLALAGDQWIGLAAVSLAPDTHSAYNQHTGVMRAFRGRKIAQALKIMALRYARQSSAQTMVTDNDSLNAPILAINRKMGYQPQPGKYWLVRWLKEDGV